MDTVFLFSIFIGLVCLVAARHHRCGKNHYRNLQTLKCTKCSTCPVNQIIRKPCHGHHDTVCGFFEEFDKFHQALIQISDDKQGIAVEKEADRTTVTTSEPETKDSFFTLETLENDGYWKTLSMALIGALCVVSIMLVAFVLITCKIKKGQEQLQEKEFHYGTESLPSEYVGLFATTTPIYDPPSSEERYVEFPIRTALTDNISQIYRPTTEAFEQPQSTSAHGYVAFAPSSS